MYAQSLICHIGTLTSCFPCVTGWYQKCGMDRCVSVCNIVCGTDCYTRFGKSVLVACSRLVCFDPHRHRRKILVSVAWVYV